MFFSLAKMASQPLRRAGLEDSLVAKMGSSGLHTVGDVFSKTELQLVEILDVDRSAVKRVLDQLATRISPEHQTAASLLRERREAGASFFVRTGLAAIDDAMQVNYCCTKHSPCECSSIPCLLASHQREWRWATRMTCSTMPTAWMYVHSHNQHRIRAPKTPSPFHRPPVRAPLPLFRVVFQQA